MGSCLIWSNMLIVSRSELCGGRPPQCCGKLMLKAFWLRAVTWTNRCQHCFKLTSGGRNFTQVYSALKRSTNLRKGNEKVGEMKTKFFHAILNCGIENCFRLFSCFHVAHNTQWCSHTTVSRAKGEKFVLRGGEVCTARVISYPSGISYILVSRFAWHFVQAISTA